MYVVILAGGGGTRLRPLSTAERPKPFLPLLGRESLLQRTIGRLRGPELDLSEDDIAIVTARRLSGLARAQAGAIGILEEPLGRNTAAAIALATVAIERADDDVMIVLPADHAIDPAGESGFRSVLGIAAEKLATGSFGVESPLVTIGVQVDRPATEYGYLIPELERAQSMNGVQSYPLRGFEEKPPRERAEVLLRQPGVAWNAGMFAWRRQAVREALATYAPEIIRRIEQGVRSGSLAAAYEALGRRPISIDYAVMEKAALDRRVVMASMSAGWSDVGSWSALLAALGVPGAQGRVVEPGETVSLGPVDLWIRRLDGRLAVEPCVASTITPDEPAAVLRDGQAYRAVVEELVARCNQWENDL